MPRRKTPIKPKEPIKLRMREVSNGNISLYLDIYHKGQRKYEYLRLYLIPETTSAARTQNANTMQAAQAIKSRRILELTNDDAGIKTAATNKITFRAYLEAYIERKQGKGQRSLTSQARALLKRLEAWNMLDVMMRDIDKRYCLRFAEHLRRSELKQATQGNYFALLTAMLNEAVRAEIIPFNPIQKLESADKPRKVSPPREYLTADEVAKLMQTPIASKPAARVKWDSLKRAFLFSCFCGLRVSDLQALRWENIQQRQGYKEIKITMQKTRQPLILPLSDEALKQLPERGNAPETATIFHGLGRYALDVLKQWAKAAGIDKNISFHTGRHTFATMLLTYGADLYAVSKLLGHSDIKITQIYAKVIDAKKVEAVNLLNGKFDTSTPER